MKNYDLEAVHQASAARIREYWPQSLAEHWVAANRCKLKREAKRLAAFRPRPPVPDEGIDYRAELDSMSTAEREQGDRLIAQCIEGKIFKVPGAAVITCKGVKLDDLDGIEALQPKFGPAFDTIRPRMAQGLTYEEAFVSVALGNHRRSIGRDSRAEFPRVTRH